MPTASDTLRVAISGCHRMLDTLPRGHNWAQAFAGRPGYDRRRGVRSRRRDPRRGSWGMEGHLG